MPPARSARSRVDPSDPSGNTVYVAGASGGIWKTTDFLTTNPNGPTYIPLTDFGPTSGIYINSIAVFARNNNPNQSIIIAGTGSTTGGEDQTPDNGRRLLDLAGRRRDLEPVRQQRSTIDANGNLLPIDFGGPQPRVRRHDGEQGRRRSPVDADRPGDHLCRLERDQRRHLAERRYGPDLAVDAGRQCDRRGPRPRQRHGLNPDTDTEVQRQSPGRLRRHR